MTDQAAASKADDGGVRLTLSIGKDVLAGWARHGISFGSGVLATHGSALVHNKTQTTEEVAAAAVAVIGALAWSAFHRTPSVQGT